MKKYLAITLLVLGASVVSLPASAYVVVDSGYYSGCCFDPCPVVYYDNCSFCGFW